MNIREALIAVVAQEVPKTEADVDVFCRAFDMYELGWSEDFNRRVYACYVETWLCTDTWVGTAIVFFDGRPFALTSKTARKSDTDLYLLEVPDAASLLSEFKTFLMSLHERESPPIATKSLDDVLELRDVRHYDKFYKAVKPLDN